MQKILPLLRALMEEEKQRRSYLITALGMDAPVLRRLEWKMPVDVFITLMVKELAVFGEVTPGKPALCAFIVLATQYKQPEYPRIPLQLPPVSRFPRTSWMIGLMRREPFPTCRCLLG
ncbi:hypothetical protein [Microcoleus sp. C2C6]|uniref:hypothetical protein n=1 Tax=Microcoleus sp. C2C6 TaxID=3055325 RepID=UPI002FD481DD